LLLDFQPLKDPVLEVYHHPLKSDLSKKPLLKWSPISKPMDLRSTKLKCRQTFFLIFLIKKNWVLLLPSPFYLTRYILMIHRTTLPNIGRSHFALSHNLPAILSLVKNHFCVFVSSFPFPELAMEGPHDRFA
jgi:hypothetical protein